MTTNLEEAKTHLHQHGWVKIPSILSKEEAAHALDQLWKAKEEAEASGEETFQPILDPNPSNVRVFYLPERGELWRKMLTNPTALELTKSFLGQHRPSGVGEHVSTLRPKYRPSRAVVGRLGGQRNLVSDESYQGERRNSLHSRFSSMDTLVRCSS